MAERDMTGRERSAVDAGPTSDAADPARDLDPELDAGGPSDGLAADLARPRSELSGGIGRLGAPAGLGGDLANLPPWSARDERGRPDRDPAALAAWRRVAERRRLRSGQDAPAVPEPAPAVSSPPPSSSSSEGDEGGENADTPLAVLGFGPASEEFTPGEQPMSGGPTADEVTPVEATPVETSAEGPASGEPSSPEPVVDEVRETEVRAHDREVDEGPPDQGSFGVHAPEPRAHDRASEPARAPRERPAGPPPVNGPDGGDRGRREHDGPGGRHEVLLALAGRLDDDALSSVRELVAVEDDAAAAELLGGSLLAADVGLTPRELTVLDAWFSAARVDAELVDALRRDPDADRRLEHRFVADPPSGTAAAVNDGPGEVIARAASRLTGVRHVRQCWRTTPAGASPGPVPHRVVLVETHGADDCEHVAHHVAHAARELGAVSVEVFATDAELPPYHRAAVASARPLGSAAAPSAGPARAPRPTMPSGVMPVLPARLRTITRGAGTTPQEAPASVPPFGVAPGGGLVSDRPETAGVGTGSDEEFRTVADAGRTSAPEARPAERDRADHDVVPYLPHEVPDDEPIDQLLDDQLGDDELRAAQPRSDDREPRFHDRDLEQERPDLVDLDPETTAERIAALWRRPVGEGDTADETESSLAPSPLSSGDTDDRPRYRPAGPEADPYAHDRSASDPSTSDASTPFAADHAGADPLDVRGESYGGAPSADVPREIGEVDPWSSASPWAGPHPDDVDPAAPTGDLSVGDLRAEERRPSSVNGHHLADHAPDDAPHHAPYDGRDDHRDDDRPDPRYDGHDDPGRVPRARHSRGGQDGTGPDPWAGGAPPAPEPHQGPPDRSEVPAASGTNGHRHAPDVESSVDPATEPVTWPAEPAPPGPRAWPDPGPTPEPTAAETTGPTEAVPAAGGPARPSYDDSVDSQLSERERELLARLHDELASRERLEAGTPDPLLGRRGPGDDGAPGGPPPGYRPGPGMPPGRANGHGLPPRPDPYPEDD